MLSICLDALESGCRLSKVKRAASVILGFQGLGLSGEQPRLPRVALP